MSFSLSTSVHAKAVIGNSGHVLTMVSVNKHPTGVRSCPTGSNSDKARQISDLNLLMYMTLTLSESTGVSADGLKWKMTSTLKHVEHMESLLACPFSRLSVPPSNAL